MSSLGLELPGEVTIESQIVDQQEYTQQYSYLSLESLDPEAQEQITDFVNRLEISTPIDVQNYGVTAQKELTDLSDSILKGTKTRDVGAIGKDITELVLLLNNFNAKVKEIEADKPNVIEKLLKSFKANAVRIQAEYTSVSANIDRVIRVLEDHMVELRSSLATMDKMYASNDKYITQLKHYIIAGKIKLEQLQKEILPELEAKATANGDPQLVQQAADFRETVYKFDKKIHNLLLSRMLSIQMSAEIRMIQKVDTQILENINDQLMLAIPAWKTQMVVAIAVDEAAKANQSSQQIADTINQSMTKTADLLKDTSLKVAEASERSIIDESTIAGINKNLIETINGVFEISQKAQQERVDKEKRMMQYEAELKNVLLR